MKYIVVQNESGEREIFIFPRSVEHAVMAEAIARLKNQMNGDWKRITRKPVSAGFVDYGMCHGNSESLRLNSCPEDTHLLTAIS